MENDITTEVSIFDTLVKKTDGFNEKDGVVYYGVGVAPANNPLRILSNLCMVPGGKGIKYTINGKQYVFDTLEHIYTFLVYGVPDNIDPWVHGGVLGDFIKTFGDDAGTSMIAKYHDMVGIIPQLIIKKGRADLRASHGIVLKSEFNERGLDENTMHYDFWRPLLLAKFAHDGPAKDALLSTDATTYLIEKSAMAPPNMEWGGKIVYPEPIHDHDAKAGCTCSVLGVNKSCMLNKIYMANKKAGTRVLGVLQGNNRMGKYLMAIRSEVRLLNGVGGIVVKREGEDPPKSKKKSKKTHTFQV